MEMEDYKRAYVRANLADEPRMERHRNKAFKIVGGHNFYKKVKPHITVIPPFYYKDDSIDELRDIVSDNNIEGENVEFNGFTVWEHISNPEYLFLDAEVDMRSEQISLLDTIRDHGGQYMKTPVSPHMTMLKTNRTWEYPTPSLKRDIQECVPEFSSVSSTEISSLEVVVG